MLMKISINTAQNVEVNYTLAGLYERSLATLMDLLILFGIVTLEGVIFHYAKIKSAWIIGGCYTLTFTYHLIFETLLNGRSPGKILMHLQVMKRNGKKLSFWDCVLRWIFRLIDSITLGATAILFIALSRNAQRLGDLAAGTIVVKHQPHIHLEQLNRYDTTDNHEISFPQVTLLSDKDIQIIQEIMEEVGKKQDYGLLDPLAQKIKETTGIESTMVNLEFIQTVLKDYHYLAKQ